MAEAKPHEQRFSIQLVDNATGKLVEQRATSKSAWTTLTTLIAGEIKAASENGWLHSYGSSKRLHEPNMTAANYDAYALNTEYIVGLIYRGSGGVIIGDDFDGNAQSLTVLDSAIFGIQPIPCMFRRLYQQGSNVNTPRGSPTETVTAFNADRVVTLYLTGSVA